MPGVGAPACGGVLVSTVVQPPDCRPILHCHSNLPRVVRLREVMTNQTGQTQMIDSIPCPPLVHLRQRLPRPRLADVDAEAARQVAPLLTGVKPGQRIAITAGSRGIADIVPILRGVVGAVRHAGGEPLDGGRHGQPRRRHTPMASSRSCMASASPLKQLARPFTPARMSSAWDRRHRGSSPSATALRPPATPSWSSTASRSTPCSASRSAAACRR